MGKVDPATNRPEENPRAREFLALIKEDVVARRLPCGHNSRYESYHTPEIFPNSYTVKREDALAWATKKGFDVSHIAARDEGP